MKTVITFLVLLVLCNCKIYSQDPTYAGIPDANRVLVVYNSNSDTSFMVANYYKNARDIPASNILPLQNLVFNDTISYLSGEVYMDAYKEVYISEYNKAAWECYVDKIKTPIENYLNTTMVNGVALKNTIRYIVMCKGVTMKLLTYIDFNADLDSDPNVEWNPSYYTKYNVSIDALTCLLYNPVINLYGTSYSSISNPFYNQADTSFMFNKRFITNYFHT